jgi:hypothetical protein
MAILAVVVRRLWAKRRRLVAQSVLVGNDRMDRAINEAVIAPPDGALRAAPLNFRDVSLH